MFALTKIHWSARQKLSGPNFTRRYRPLVADWADVGPCVRQASRCFMDLFSCLHVWHLCSYWVTLQRCFELYRFWNDYYIWYIVVCIFYWKNIPLKNQFDFCQVQGSRFYFSIYKVHIYKHSYFLSFVPIHTYLQSFVLIYAFALFGDELIRSIAAPVWGW